MKKNDSDSGSNNSRRWKRMELSLLILYAIAFYSIIIRRSLHLSRDLYSQLHGLRPGWLTIFTQRPNIFARKKYFLLVLWSFNIFFLLCNRVYGGYSFSMIGKRWAYLDNFRGTFRWHICFNFVVLRMISFGYDYHWADKYSHFDQKKHIQRCDICKSGKTCYQTLQERCVQNGKYAYSTYICYLVYAPLYLAGPIINFNAFASQLDVPQNNYSARDKTHYGLRWIFSLVLMELMTHLFHYNAFAISGLWKQLAPMDVFIIGYGVLNFMWLKFFLVWRYFRFWSLICGIEAPENMPRCINNCCNLESFWKNWHASYNKWLVRYMYIPLGGSQKKLVNVWVIFTFVAIWHDLEWKLLSWAWLTCLFFVPEMMLKSAATTFQVMSVYLPHLFARNYLILVIVLQLASFVFFPTRIILCFFRKVENFPFTMI
ncbi:hypothetical protein I3760_01G000600 [Carya illinoinensis]|nr:hypothetical protein I3760_01G000600 [Carya illinoinensis]